ncbi:MAG TPA: PepSY domain-containing protein [Gemmatimonadaceae bacterium]
MQQTVTRTVPTFAAALVAIAFGATSLAAQGVGAGQSYPRDLPPALVKQAEVSETEAAKAALARVPKGRIQAVELEREDGALLYSYEIKVPGRTGIEEVNVDARTGAVHSTEHETPSKERKEAADEKRSRRP